MIEIAFAQFLFKLLLGVTAVAAMTGTLMLLNHLTGDRFDETLRNASPDVRLYYFGMRLIGYAFIMGSVLS